MHCDCSLFCIEGICKPIVHAFSGPAPGTWDVETGDAGAMCQIWPAQSYKMHANTVKYLVMPQTSKPCRKVLMVPRPRQMLNSTTTKQVQYNLYNLHIEWQASMINKYVSQDSSLPREWRIRSYSIPMPPDVSISMCGESQSDAFAVAVDSNKHITQENAKKQCYHVISTIPLANHSLTKITLLRVIPTMTCWVEVVRWGLSLRIWWEEWRISKHWFQVSLA